MNPDRIPAPDLEVPCCMASAVSDGENCTCWRPVLDPPPSGEEQAGPMQALRRSCHDCAYRLDSPERAAGEAPEFGPAQPFLCHQGMPRVIRWEHPSGATITPEGDDYQPTEHGGRAWLADGRPGEYCAGWAATNQIRTPREERR